jgi:putative ABC transport system substrate-binding protein
MTTVALGLLASRDLAHAQRPAKRPVVAWISGTGSLDVPSFLTGLRAHGYVPGQTVSFDRYEAPPGGAHMSGVINRLMSTNPDVIVASTAEPLDAITRVAKTVPVVGIDLQSDPVARGWIPRPPRPRTNVTGIFLDIAQASAQELRLLREVKPDLSRVAVLGMARINDVQFRATEAAAQTAGVVVHSIVVKALDEVRAALGEASKQGATGLVATASPLFANGLRIIADAALTHRLASICPAVPEFPEAGGLVGYGPSAYDAYRRAGDYVGRILKGSSASALPIQPPGKFLLVLNGQTARTLKLTFPPPLVQRADRVIG